MFNVLLLCRINLHLMTCCLLSTYKYAFPTSFSCVDYRHKLSLTLCLSFVPDRTNLGSISISLINPVTCFSFIGLVPIKLSNGDSILKGQTVTSFTNSEEDAVELSAAMPFMLETRLKELGASFTSAANFQPHVVVSEIDIFLGYSTNNISCPNYIVQRDYPVVVSENGSF